MQEYTEFRHASRVRNSDLFVDDHGVEDMLTVLDQAQSKRIFGKYTSIDNYQPSTSKTLSGRADVGRQYVPRFPRTVGWTDCGHNLYEPGIVLDPFVGSGSTGEVALKMGRSFIGVDLYSNFADMAKQRCQGILDQIDSGDIPPAIQQYS